MELIKFYISNTYHLNKSVFLFLFFYSLCHQIKAQVNLVPNGSFEEYNWCPNTTDGYYIEACKFWTNPTLGTSDYFNSCSTELDTWGQNLYSVPENYYGNQMANTGEAYAGFAFGQLTGITQPYAEYIQVELIQSLEANKIYELTFYVHNPTEICPNSVGCFFSENKVLINNDDILHLIPQFQSDLSSFICDTLNWTEMRGFYFAEGNEKFITIGVFTPLYELKLSDYQGSIITGPGVGGSLLMYVDDVSLKAKEYSITNVFTPNDDGINDLFKIDNTIFHADEIYILNRWGNIVYQSDSIFEWDGKATLGLECTNGVYYYRINKKGKNIKNGFVSLIR